VNNTGDGTLFDRSLFIYHPDSDTFLCPAGQTLTRKQRKRKHLSVTYAAPDGTCPECPLKPRCTTSSMRRFVERHFYEDALNRMRQRTTPEAMRLRRSTVEHPFGTLKYRIFGHPRFLLRGVAGAQVEMSLATMAYNLKRMINVLGAGFLSRALATT